VESSRTRAERGQRHGDDAGTSRGIIMNFLRALLLYYVDEFRRLLLVLAAIVIAMLGTALLSAVISFVFGLGSDKLDFLLPVCFLAVLAGEAFAYQRYLRWRFFKDLTK
jgi:hypothetical protein